MSKEAKDCKNTLCVTLNFLPPKLLKLNWKKELKKGLFGIHKEVEKRHSPITTLNT